jgi:hypothetical protein
LPLPEPAIPEPALGDVLDVLIGEKAAQHLTGATASAEPGPAGLRAAPARSAEPGHPDPAQPAVRGVRAP